MRPVTLVCGVQGSGKSWVCRQLTGTFDYIPHDRCWSHPDAVPDTGLDPAWGPKGSKSTHLPDIIAAAGRPGKPLLTEAPFGERELRDNLTKSGVRVTCVFIIEAPEVLEARYRGREGRSLPPGVIGRALSLPARAATWGAFAGTSAQVLAHLGRRPGRHQG